jgi:hypothetical protein
MIPDGASSRGDLWRRVRREAETTMAATRYSVALYQPRFSIIVIFAPRCRIRLASASASSSARS